ncbi:MAG: ATP-binding cassette domain-containing protein [Devosia sp.]
MSAEATPPKRRRPRMDWRIAFVFSVLALASAVLLTGVSVWFLGAVALAGATPAALTFNFHHPAALVRFLALTRVVTKYGERMFGHRAALLDQVDRRFALFGAMARSPRAISGGWQLGREDRLNDFIDDVDHVDHKRLRSTFPAITLASCASALFVATAIVTPLAAVLIVALAALAVFVGLRTRHAVEAAEGDARQTHREAAARLGAALGAIVPLAAERRRDVVLGEAAAAAKQAEAAIARQRAALAPFEAASSIVGPAAALVVMVAAFTAGLRDEALLVPGFLAFSWLALSEAVQGVAAMLLGDLKARAAQTHLTAWPVGENPSDPERVDAIGTLDMRNLRLETPAGRTIATINALTLERGRPTVLIGPSGCGKTTLLKALAGWVDGPGEVDADGKPFALAERRAATHLSLHDAAILSDTVRGNLFADTASDEAIWSALDAVEMVDRVKDAGGLDGWITQDQLSLGEAQRINLARAFLTERPLVLLDEPAEHVGYVQADRIMRRLSDRLANKVVLMTSHMPFGPPGAAVVAFATIATVPIVDTSSPAGLRAKRVPNPS